jgi:hypothetical protein
VQGPCNRQGDVVEHLPIHYVVHELCDVTGFGDERVGRWWGCDHWQGLHEAGASDLGVVSRYLRRRKTHASLTLGWVQVVGGGEKIVTVVASPHIDVPEEALVYVFGSGVRSPVTL